MSLFEDEEETQKKDCDHPDFIIEQIGNKFESLYLVWMIDFITKEKKECFGSFGYWWQAERESRKLQVWSDAEDY